MASVPRKRFAILLLSVLMGLMLTANLLPQASAAGGSRSQTGVYAQPAWTTVTSASSGTSASIPNVIKNDYIVVLVGFSGTGQSVKAVNQGIGTPSFSKTGGSQVNQDTEIYCQQYTSASGSIAVTVSATATATFVFTVYILAGLSSCSGATVQPGSGTSAAMLVNSFTPATGSSCIGIGNEFAGQAGVTYTQANPFQFDNGGGAPNTSPNTSPNFGNQYSVAILRGAWNSNDGPTTAQITPSGTSSPTWDEVVACYATSSAGNEVYNSAGRGGGRQNTNTPNEGVNAVLQGDYILQFTGIEGTAVTVSNVGDTNGGSDSWAKVASSNVRDDVEIWMAQAAQSSAGPSGFQVTSTLTNTAADSMVLGWDIGSISSTTPEVFSNSGTAASISLSSAVTPNANDLCIEAAAINTGSASTPTITVGANQPFQDLGTNTGIAYGNLYEVIVIRADWPSGVSTSGIISVSPTSSPTWDVVVACFPGTVIVPLTCTMDNGAVKATLSLSESSGNALTPTSANCDGLVHNVTVDPSVTLTATEPADVPGTYTRDRFSGGTTTTTDAVCAGSVNGLCPAFSFTNYEQLQNTYEATPNAQSTWDVGLTAPGVVGQVAGAAGTTGCTIPITGGGGAASCTAWFDYNRAVVIGTSTLANAPSNTQWLRSGSCSFSQTTGGVGIDNCNFYKQLWETYEAVPFAPSSWDVSGLSLDGSGGNICTNVATCSASLKTNDPSDVIIVFCYSLASGTGGAVTSYTVSATGLSFTARLFYSGQRATGEDWAVAASPLNPAVSISCTLNAGAGTTNLGVMAFGVNGVLTSSPYDPSSSLPNEQSSTTTTGVCTMSTSNPSDFLIGETTHNGASLNSIPLNFNPILAFSGSPSGAVEYLVVSGIQSAIQESWTYGSGSVSDNICDALEAALTAVGVTGTSLGSTGQTICTMNLPTAGSSAATTCAGYSDYNTVVTMGNLVVSLNERWSPLVLTYQDMTGGIFHLDNYYEQLQNRYQAQPTSPRTWDAALSILVTGTQLGSGGMTICTIATTSGGGAVICQGYADYNTPVTVASPVVVSATEQWAASTANVFTDSTGGNTHTVVYVDQYSFPTSDTLSFSESVSRALFLPRAASDVYTVSESPGRQTGATRAATDSFSFSDSSARIVSAVRVGSDSFAFTDAATSAFSGSRTAADSYVVSDSASRQSSAPRAASDSAAFSDSVTRGLALSQPLADSLPFADSPLRSLALGRSVGDGFASTEASVVQTVLGRLAQDATSFVDSVQRALSLQQTVADTSIFTEVAATISSMGRAVSDAFAASTSAVSTLGFLRGAGDAFAYTESVLVNSFLAREASDVFSVTENLARSLSLTQQVSDVFNLADNALSQLNFGRGIGDLLPFSDSPGRALALVQNVLDSFVFSELPRSLSDFVRAVADTVPMSDLPSGIVSFARSIVDVFPFQDAVARSLQLIQTVSDQYLFSDSLGQTIRLLRNIFSYVSDSYVFSDTASRMEALVRSIMDPYSFSIFVQRTLSIDRSAVDQYLQGAVSGGLLALRALVSDLWKTVDSYASSITTVTSSSSSTTSSTGGGRPTFLGINLVFYLWALLLLALLVLLAFVRRRRRSKESASFESA